MSRSHDCELEKCFDDAFSYHPAGAVAQYVAGNGVTHTITFDERARPLHGAGGHLLSEYDLSSQNVLTWQVAYLYLGSRLLGAVRPAGVALLALLTLLLPASALLIPQRCGEQSCVIAVAIPNWKRGCK